MKEITSSEEFVFHGLPEPPSEGETRELVALAQAGDTNAKKALLEGHLRLVVRCAKAYGWACERGTLDLADLVQEGVFGLAEAVDHFSSERGVPFASYASFWIRKVIEEHVNSCAFSTRLPRWVADKYKRAWAIENNGAALKDALESAGLDDELFGKIRGSAEALSIDACVAEGDDEFCAHSFLAAPGNFEEGVEEEICVEDFLRKAKGVLPERYYEAFVRHAGIGCEPQSLREIGAACGVCAETARGMIVRSKRRLAKVAEEAFLEGV